MNTQKLTLSLIASAFLTTTAFAAGTLNLSGGSGASTTEYIEKYGNTNALNLGDIIYTADIGGSGSVSDALIRLDLTDTNLTSTAHAALDTINSGGPARLVNEDNETVGIYDKKIAVNGRIYFLFDGDATKSIVDGIDYRIANDDNSSVSITYGFVTGTAVKLDVYSTSGTEELRDEAEGTVSTSETKQFKTNCVAKFDGLINFENFRQSFVNSTHDNVATDTTDRTGLTDTLVFTVDNARGTGNSLDGNSSVLSLFTVSDATKSVVNVDNNFSNATEWTVSVNQVDPDGTSTVSPITDTAANSAFDNATELDYNVTNGKLDISFADAEIKDGLTTFYVSFSSATAETIAPVRFVNSSFAIEGGEADGNNSIAPARNTGTEDADLGLWQDHAYIAQIAGATQDAATQTKLFIVNRSCAAVTPMFRLVKDGVVTEIEGTEIATDVQQRTLLSTLLTKANLADGRYALEIILPGIAEDFYVYAQAQGKANKAITKDLPINDTSDRN